MTGMAEAQKRQGGGQIHLPPPPPNLRQPIDREKTCPLLLRVFTKIGGHHSNEDFVVRGKEPKDEVQIYTWKDATLRELTDLVKEVAPAARRREAILSFAFVYPAKSGRFVVREVGQTYYSNRIGKLDDVKTLAELCFELANYIYNKRKSSRVSEQINAEMKGSHEEPPKASEAGFDFDILLVDF